MKEIDKFEFGGEIHYGESKVSSTAIPKIGKGNSIYINLEKPE